jgi:hypothetical protein
LISKKLFLQLSNFLGHSFYCFSYFLDISLLNGLLFSIPLSILSSAIILPSIEDLDEDKREFMIYESTFSDIVGIIRRYEC